MTNSQRPIPKVNPIAPQEKAQNTDWMEFTAFSEWISPNHAIGRNFKNTFEGLRDAGFSISYSGHISTDNVHLWSLCKGKERGFLTYEVREEQFYVTSVKRPIVRPNIPDGVIWQE